MKHVFILFRNYNLLVGQDEEHSCMYENLDEIIDVFDDCRKAQHEADRLNEFESIRNPYSFEECYHVERWDIV